MNTLIASIRWVEHYPRSSRGMYTVRFRMPPILSDASVARTDETQFPDIFYRLFKNTVIQIDQQGVGDLFECHDAFTGMVAHELFGIFPCFKGYQFMPHGAEYI